MSVIDSKKKLRTYWDRLEAMSGEDIDYSNIPPMDQRFFTKCEYLLLSDHFYYCKWTSGICPVCGNMPDIGVLDNEGRRVLFWRPDVTDVIYRYLECGDMHFGFARVKCQDCGHEYLLAYSCKRRHFCPSCHPKRVVEFGEWLCTQVLKLVPHRQWVFSIPKRLRLYFLFNRKLLAKLSRCAWKVLCTYLKQSVPFDGAAPGAAIAVHTFGDFQQFNPHLHLIATDGCFSNGGWLNWLPTSPTRANRKTN